MNEATIDQTFPESPGPIPRVDDGIIPSESDSGKVPGTVYDLNTAPDYYCLTAEDLMATLGIGKTTLWKKIKQKDLPPPFDFCAHRAQWTVGQIRLWRDIRAKAKARAARKEILQSLKNTRSRIRGEFDPS